jgi:hypothetical protein
VLAAAGRSQHKFTADTKRAEGSFAQTFLSTGGKWTDPQYRWARGVAPSAFDERSTLPVTAHPAEQAWDGVPPPVDGGGKWCFYNVLLPHAELSWIETTQVAEAALDEVVGTVFEAALVRSGTALTGAAALGAGE